MTRKMEYEAAVAEVVLFDNSDVITTSGNTYCMSDNGFENAFD